MTITTIIDSFELKLKACVREVKGKRKVYSGTWNNEEVFVKVFISSDSAQRHFKRDLEGIEAFNRAKVLTPELLWSGKFPNIDSITGNSESYGIIVKAVPKAESLEQRWKSTVNKKELLNNAVGILASHHNGGLIQTDIHFGNFLYSENECYSLDGDALEFFQGKDRKSVV